MNNLRISSRICTGIPFFIGACEGRRPFFVGMDGAEWMQAAYEKQERSLSLYNEFIHIVNVVVKLCMVSPRITNLHLLSLLPLSKPLLVYL